MRQDALHELIHSLAPNERRYFRLFSLPGSGMGADSNYMRLFEALLAQPQYDEAALRAQFAGQKLLAHLSAEKSYLYRLLLRCLRTMREDASTRLRIRTQVENATLLFERGLYTQARKALKRARALAEAAESDTSLLEILVLERRLWKILHEKDRQAIADRLIQEQTACLQRLHHTYAYYDLYDRMYLLTHQKFSMRTHSEHPALVAILADPLLADMTQADSFEARQFYWLCQAWRHQLQGDQVQLYEAFAALVAWWEAHPVQVEADPGRYVVVLSNFLHAASQRTRYAEFPAVFAKIRQARPSHQHADVQVMQSLHYYELLYALNMADWDAAATCARQSTAFLAEAGSKVAIGRRLAFWYNLAILEFILENFSAALHWVNTILDESGAELREDIQHFARILVVLIHFELGHWEILEYLHRSGYRYLFNHGQLFPYEKRLMDALRALMNQPDAAMQAQALQSLQTDLRQDFAETQHGPGFQELFCWVEARLTRRPMREVMAATIQPRA
jgi:hypothetical protein